MDTNELPELQLGSRTQDAAAVQQVLDELGYESIAVDTQTDEPAAAEDTPATEDTPNSSVPSPEAGGEAAGDEEEGESTTDSETVEEQDDTRPTEKKKKPSGYKKKISKLEQELGDLRRQLEERSSLQRAEEPLPDVSADPEPEPDQDDLDDDGNPRYASDSDFFKARVAWSQRESKRQEILDARAARETKAKENADAQAVADQKAVADRWNEQMDIGKSKHDDFEAVFEQSKTMRAEVALTEAIQDSDFSAELVYHLAKNPEELDRLNKLLKPAPEKAGSAVEFRRKLRLAHVEISALEARILKGAPDTDQDDTPDYAAPGSEETPGTDAARESREKAAPVPPAPAVKTAPAATPKKKPEPIRPVGSRGGTTKKRLQQMTREEVHALDPDELRRLVEAG